MTNCFAGGGHVIDVILIFRDRPSCQVVVFLVRGHRCRSPLIVHIMLRRISDLDDASVIRTIVDEGGENNSQRTDSSRFRRRVPVGRQPERLVSNSYNSSELVAET